jgi:NADH-ubiquinone oxidoreductase chain 6
MIKEYLIFGLNESLKDFSSAIYSSYHPVSLDIISVLCIISCILCVSINNPVISVLFLIGLFANVGLYLILLGISFIGLVYIVIYIGAVTILFLFVIMLINIQLSQIKTYNINNGIPIGLSIGISF